MRLYVISKEGDNMLCTRCKKQEVEDPQFKRCAICREYSRNKQKEYYKPVEKIEKIFNEKTRKYNYIKRYGKRGRKLGTAIYTDDITFNIFENQKVKLKEISKKLNISESDIYRILIQKMIDNPLQFEKENKTVSCRVRVTPEMRREFYKKFGKNGVYFLNLMINEIIENEGNNLKS